MRPQALSALSILLVIASACNPLTPAIPASTRVTIPTNTPTTAVASAIPPAATLPTVFPTNTPRPPTATSVPPTSTPRPSPTPLVLVVQVVIPGNLDAKILAPNYSPAATTSLVFQVTARTKGSNRDGTGVKSVVFRFLDSNGNAVYARTEMNSPYCAFGDNGTSCDVWVFAQHNRQWPNGTPIRNGTYKLDVTVNPLQGSDSQRDDFTFKIQLP